MPGLTPRRILVPVNGISTDNEAVRLACRLSKRERAEVVVVTVLEVRRAVPLGEVQGSDLDRAEALLDAAEEIAKELDVAIHTELLQAREAGPALTDEATRRRIDVVVVGVPFRRRYDEFHLGRTTLYLLRHLGCRILLLRDAPDADALG